MKILISIFLFLYLFASDIENVFHTSFVKTKKGIEFTIDMDKNIHIYKDSIKIFVDNKIYTPLLPTPSVDKFGTKIYTKQLKLTMPIKSGEIKVVFQGCSDLVCYPPQTKVYNIKEDVSSQDNNIKNLFNKSIWIILGSFFVFGLLLSLTPCIFPMIPILSGLIVKNLKNPTPIKGLMISFVYVISMSITYTIAGVMAGMFGSNIQILFQNPYIISIFSLIFILLALSMFGFFEIGLPSSIQTKLTLKSDKASKGGMIGVAIMGFLSALIVGPCVAPPLAGALIYIGQTGDAILGGSALFVMSLGMGVPLFIIGLGAGKFMPKAGSWMININRIFGVIMLAISIYMISRIIPQNITIILWGILSIGTGLYLAPFEKMNSYKDVLLKTFAFLLVLIGSIAIFKVLNSSNNVVVEKQLNWQKTKNLDFIKGDVIVDFTAKWCVACKEYEETTFSNPKVIEELKKYKLLKIDVTKNTLEDKIIMKKYQIIGPPAILIFRNGKLFKKIVGYKSPKEFLEIIKK